MKRDDLVRLSAGIVTVRNDQDIPPHLWRSPRLATLRRSLCYSYTPTVHHHWKNVPRNATKSLCCSRAPSAVAPRVLTSRSQHLRGPDSDTPLRDEEHRPGRTSPVSSINVPHLMNRSPDIDRIVSSQCIRAYAYCSTGKQRVSSNIR